MNTTTSPAMRRVARGAVLAAATALIGLGAPAVGHADTDPGPTAGPGMGCETIMHWEGMFSLHRRKVCDGPIQPDGSWQRTRVIWVPAYTVPSPCFRDFDNSNSAIDCNPRYSPQRTLDQETYPVTPDTVLPDEPGWLPPNTDNIL